MKKRVYELAKEYGLDGPILASKLRELGFDKVKTHMAVLDEFDLMMIQARLEASGLIPEKAAAPAATPAAPVVEEETAAKAKKTKGAKKEKTVKEKAAEEEQTAAAAETSAKETHKKAAAEKPEKKAPEKTAEEPVAKAKEIHKGQAPEKEAPAVKEKAPAAPQKPPLPPPKPAPPRRTATILGRIDPSLLGPKASPKEREKETSTPLAASGTGAAKPKLTAAEEEEEARNKKAGKKPRIAPEDEDFKDGLNVHPTFFHDPHPTLARGDAASRERLTAAQLREREEGRYQRRRDAQRGRRSGRDDQRQYNAASNPAAPITAERKSKIVLDPPVNVKSLAIALGLKPAELIRKLMENKVMATMNTALDDETVNFMALEFGQEVEIRKSANAEQDVLDQVQSDTDAGKADPSKLVHRPPIIAFLGHVDHGKTSLLDAIRQSSVTKGEAGGITQHIGAYQVTTEKGHKITILDTPGHEAFTAMRARGANTTDIVILVVAADDGVMPQTLEAINHAKAAKVPIIIALNKIDKGDANPQKVRQQLASAELAPEDWGGSIGIVETSATKNIGIQNLLDRVMLESEVLELRANVGRTAVGTVLEASISEGRGIIAHLLVQDGILNCGDVILAGTGYGRVRNLYNDRGEELKSAGPSTPVEVTGLSALPQAGDKFYIVPDLTQAREVAENRQSKSREMQRTQRPAVSLENLFERIKTGKTKELQVILKTDMQGSLEALKKELENLKGKEVNVRLLHSAAGGINESDVDLAASSDAIVLGFHVVADEKARQKADRLKVEVRTYQIIYELIEDIKKAMEGMLAPSMREALVGHATIRQVFRISKFGNIAGCYVTDGSILRANPVRLIRNSVIVYSGKLSSLKRMKDDVREVKTGFECGIKLDNYEDIKEGDIIESFEIKEEKRLLG